MTASTPRTALPERPWTRAAAAVAASLGMDGAHGLSASEAARRLAQVGPNELLERGQKPPWRLFLEQFTNTMIVVLLIAAIVTALIGDLKDTLVILAIVVLNGIIGFTQEYRAEQAMAALKQMTSPTARVVRDGAATLVAASLLVPGDLVLLEAGDIAAADLRLLEAIALHINEAALTGESEPAAKVTDALPTITEALLADQRNMAFKGTAVTSGRGSGVVVATGMRRRWVGSRTCSRSTPPAPPRSSNGCRRSARVWRRPPSWCARSCSWPAWRAASRSS